MNEREAAILSYINQQIRDKGYPPSVREIGAAVGLKSSSTVHNYLSALEEKGLIRRDATKPRAIEVLYKNEGFQPERKMVNVPLVGKITAGEPILAAETADDVFPLPYDLVGSEDTFMLTVRGESMVEAGILDGDLLLVRKQSYAQNGDIVVALLEEEATVKRFYKEARQIRLQPENKYMDPIYATDVAILGKVIGLFRQY